MSYEWTSNRIWNISGILTEYGTLMARMSEMLMEY